MNTNNTKSRIAINLIRLFITYCTAAAQGNSKAKDVQALIEEKVENIYAPAETVVFVRTGTLITQELASRPFVIRALDRIQQPNEEFHFHSEGLHDLLFNTTSRVIVRGRDLTNVEYETLNKLYKILYENHVTKRNAYEVSITRTPTMLYQKFLSQTPTNATPALEVNMYAISNVVEQVMALERIKTGRMLSKHTRDSFSASTQPEVYINDYVLPPAKWNEDAGWSEHSVTFEDKTIKFQIKTVEISKKYKLPNEFADVIPTDKISYGRLARPLYVPSQVILIRNLNLSTNWPPTEVGVTESYIGEVAIFGFKCREIRLAISLTPYDDGSLRQAEAQVPQPHPSP